MPENHWGKNEQKEQSWEILNRYQKRYDENKNGGWMEKSVKNK
jgi:hypothetical protein